MFQNCRLAVYIPQPITTLPRSCHQVTRIKLLLFDISQMNAMQQHSLYRQRPGFTEHQNNSAVLRGPAMWVSTVVRVACNISSALGHIKHWGNINKCKNFVLSTPRVLKVHCFFKFLWRYLFIFPVRATYRWRICSIGGITLIWGNRSTGRKTCSNATSSTINHT